MSQPFYPSRSRGPQATQQQPRVLTQPSLLTHYTMTADVATFVVTGKHVALVGPAPYTGLEAASVGGTLPNLLIMLDAGDPASWPGSGIRWLDTWSGGYDFYRDFDGTITTSDPTFNGSVGDQQPTAYWSFDGADYFRYDSVSETWMENWHKDGALFTAAFWVYLTDSGAQYLYGEAVNTNTNIGVTIYVSQANEQGVFAVSKGSAPFAAEWGGFTHLPGLALNKWQLIFLAVDEATGKYQWQLGAAPGPEVTGVSYASPSASAATARPDIADAGSQVAMLASGSRMFMFAAWDRYLTVAERTAFYALTGPRVGQYHMQAEVGTFVLTGRAETRLVAPTSLENFKDTFTTLDGAVWGTSGANPPTMSGGLLRIPAKNTYDNALFSQVGTYRLTDSSIYLNGWSFIGGDSSILLGITLEQTSDSTYQVKWEVVDGIIKALYKSAGVDTTVRNDLAQDGVAQKFLRIREAAGTIYWDYSADASSWTNYASVAKATIGINTDQVKVVYFAGAWNDQTGVSAVDAQNVTAAAYSMTADPAAFVLTGVDAGLLYGRKVAADVGAFTLTGADAGLYHGYPMVAAAGVFLVNDLGAEVFSNPGFATDLTDWALHNAATIAWNSDGGVGAAEVNITGSGGGIKRSAATSLNLGSHYRFTVRLREGTYDGVIAVVAEAAVLGSLTPLTSAYSDWTVDWRADAASVNVLALQRGTAVTGTIYVDTFSVKPLPGVVRLLWGHAVAADVGAFTLTGVNANLLRGYRLAADVGAFVLTGNSAGLSRGVPMAAATAAFTLTGSSAGLWWGHAMAADVGAFVLTGNDAEPYRSNVVGETAVFVVTGIDVGLTYDSADPSMPAAVGAFVLTGNDAGLHHGYRMTADVGAFVLTGTDAGLYRGYPMAAGVGTFALTGADAGLLWGHSMAAAVGAFTLTGVAAGTLWGRRLAAEFAPFGVNTENQLAYSEEFDQVSWNKLNATITPDVYTAPNGIAMDKLVENTGSTEKQTYRSRTKAASSILYTASVFFKAAERSWGYIYVQGNGSANRARAWFNLATGVKGGNSQIGGCAVVDYTIEDAGDGVYRCTLSATTDTSTGVVAVYGVTNADLVVAYTGDGASGLYLGGAQLNVGLPLPYVRTSGAIVLGGGSGAVNLLWGHLVGAGVGTFVLTGSAAALSLAHKIVAESGSFAVNNENLLTYSEDLTKAAWVIATPITPDATTAPDGQVTADLGVVAAGGFDRKTQNVVSFPATAVTLVCHFKPSTGQGFQLGIRNATTATNLHFRAFSFSGMTSGATWGFTGPDAQGFYRAWITQSTGITIGDTVTFYLYFDTAPPTVGEGVYVWGAEVKRGALNPPPPYIRTEASQVTAGGSFGNVDLLWGHRLDAGLGAFILTGSDAGLARGYPMAADPGAFILTGIDAALLYGRALEAEVGAFVFVANDAGLLNDRRLGAEVGAFVLSGGDAGLFAGYAVTAEVGEFVLTGIDADLKVPGKLPAEPGEFVLTGTDTGLLRGYRITVETGEFVLTLMNIGRRRRVTGPSGVLQHPVRSNVQTEVRGDNLQTNTRVNEQLPGMRRVG